MDYLALKSSILANHDCQNFIVTNDMPKQNAADKDQAIADIFNAPNGTRITEKYINDIGLLRELGVVTGATIVKKLEALAATNDVLAIVMRAFKSDRGIDVGNSETRSFLDLVAVPDANALPTDLTISEVGLIKALAELPSSLAYQSVGKPITGADVSIALRNY